MLAGGRAPVHHEPVAAHPGWWPASAAALNAERSAADTPGHPVCGVTPAFIATDIMRAVIRRLTLLAEQAHQNWPDYLAARATSDDQTWTEYALYWTQLLNTQPPETLHTPRRLYEFCHALDQAEARVHFGAATPSQPLFAVLQSSYIPAAAHAAYVEQSLRTTELPAGPRPASLRGHYPYVAGRAAQSALEQYAEAWLVTPGAQHTDTAARVANGPRDWLVGHFPHPLPITRPGFRALYVFDEPATIAIETFRRDRRITLARNTNRNLPAAWLQSLTLASYADSAQDHLNLAAHFEAWTTPTGPLHTITYPVLLLRRAAIPRYATQVRTLFGQAIAEALQVPDQIEPHPPPAPKLLHRLHQMYAALTARIDAFPDAALWDPRSASLTPLPPPPGLAS